MDTTMRSAGSKVHSMMSECSSCHKKSTEELKECGVCRSALYCNVECQKADWTSHKATCTRIATLQLIEAMHADDESTVRRLAKTKRVLNGRVDYSTRTKDGEDHTLSKWTALHDCIREDNKKMAKILIEHGANVEIKDADGETPVFVAATGSESPDMTKMLLSAGANPNTTAADGWSCLMMAARDGNYEVTKALLEAGAKINGACDMFGRNSLHIVDHMRKGQGVRMTTGEKFEDAKKRYERLYTLLSQYA